MTETTNFGTTEILEALEDHLEDGDGWHDFTEYVPGADLGSRWRPLTITIDGTDYTVTEIERTGGEGEGSRASVLIGIGSQFFRKSGYYASHYGTDWDGDFTEVKPVVKTVTVFE